MMTHIPAAAILDTIKESLTTTFYNMWISTLDLIPKLVSMLVILLVGLIIAKVLRSVVLKVLEKIKFDTLCDKTGLHEATASMGVTQTFSHIFSQCTFFGTMLIFLTAAVDVLGMESLTSAISSLLGYIPSLIAALVVLMAGLVLANFVRSMVTNMTERTGFEYGAAVGTLVYGLVLMVIGNLAVKQLQIETDLVDRIIEIGMMAAGAALALSLGLGTRDVARNVIAGVYARESFEPGASLVVGEDSCTVEAVRSVNTMMKTGNGKTIYVPNATLMDMQVVRN